MIKEINEEGIKAAGNVDTDSWILISLPYENGYEILVDGVKTDYESYRDALILVKMSAGSHEISIRYITPGFRLGILMSVISALFTMFIGLYEHGKVQIQNS